MDITKQIFESIGQTSNEADWNDELGEMCIGNLIDYQETVINNLDSNSIDWAENEFTNQLTGFVRAGLIAAQVKHQRLHLKTGYQDFKDWCSRALKRTHWYVNKLIDAARVVMELVYAGFKTLPTCEAQCRPLVKLICKKTGSTDELIQAWHEIVETTAPQHITTHRIQEHFNELIPPKKRQISLPKELYERLEKQAQSKGLTVEELLEEFVGDDEQSEPSAEQQTAWQDDVKQMVQQQNFVEAIETFMQELEPRKASARVAVAWDVLSKLRCQFVAIGTS